MKKSHIIAPCFDKLLKVLLQKNTSGIIISDNKS